MNNSQVEAIAAAFIGDLLQHDWESALNRLAVDAPIVVTGRHALAGTFTGSAQFLEIQTWIFREHDAGIDVVRCDELMTSDSMAVAIVEERAHRDIRSLRYRRIVVMTVEGESIVELKLIAEDPYALDQFWE